MTKNRDFRPNFSARGSKKILAGMAAKNGKATKMEKINKIWSEGSKSPSTV